MKKLIAAHRRAAKAQRELSIAIQEHFLVGLTTYHNKGAKPGNWIRVQVEMVSFNRIKVWNPDSGKSQWVHYWYFMPKDGAPHQIAGGSNG